MKTDEMKDAVRKFWGGMNNSDLESQIALCSDGVVFTVTGTTAVSGSNVGIEQVRAHFDHFGSLIEPKWSKWYALDSSFRSASLSEESSRSEDPDSSGESDDIQLKGVGRNDNPLMQFSSA